MLQQRIKLLLLFLVTNFPVILELAYSEFYEIVVHNLSWFDPIKLESYFS